MSDKEKLPHGEDVANDKDKLPHFPSVKVISDHPTSAEVSIDGKKLNNVRSIVYEQDTESLASFTFETYGIPDLNFDQANVFVICTPKTITEAARLIRHAIRTDKDMRAAWVKSIETGLRENLLIPDDDALMYDGVNVAEVVVSWLADDKSSPSL